MKTSTLVAASAGTLVTGLLGKCRGFPEQVSRLLLGTMLMDLVLLL